MGHLLAKRHDSFVNMALLTKRLTCWPATILDQWVGKLGRVQDKDLLGLICIAYEIVRNSTIGGPRPTK